MKMLLGLFGAYFCCIAVRHIKADRVAEGVSWQRIHKICGRPSIEPFTGINEEKISNDDTAKPHSWPWQVSIKLFDVGMKAAHHKCGGSIIAPNKILTAAHCILFSYDPHRYLVAVGKHNLFTDEPLAKAYSVKRFTVHDGFDWNKSQFPDDIVVLTLTEDMDFNEHVNPICIPQSGPASDLPCYVMGWGKDNKTNFSALSAVLKQIDMPIQLASDCENQNFQSIVFNSTKMICAGPKRGGKDTCKGDSGGPLVCKENGVWYQYGIVSGGKGCGNQIKPGVYTRVTHYFDWLHDERRFYHHD